MKPTFQDLQVLAEKERALGARSDRAVARLFAGKIGPAYPRRLAREWEEVAGDLDRLEYQLGIDRYAPPS